MAALKCTSDNPWMKIFNHFKKIHDVTKRTAGIEAVTLSNQKYGDALFYDFAGQSQYHGPHQSFLEAMLSKPGVSVTLLLLVKATEKENIITEQLYRWLQPLALMSTPSTPKVIVVGSFFDQAKSRKEACEKLLRCTQSVEAELHLDIQLQGPCLLDCRQPESKGINQICTFLQEVCPVNTKALPYNLHWVLVQVRKAFSITALRLHGFQTYGCRTMLESFLGTFPHQRRYVRTSQLQVTHSSSLANRTPPKVGSSWISQLFSMMCTAPCSVGPRSR